MLALPSLKGLVQPSPCDSICFVALSISMTRTPASRFAPTSTVSGLSVFSRKVTQGTPSTPPPGPPPESVSARPWHPPPVAETPGTPAAQRAHGGQPNGDDYYGAVPRNIFNYYNSCINSSNERPACPSIALRVPFLISTPG